MELIQLILWVYLDNTTIHNSAAEYSHEYLNLTKSWVCTGKWNMYFLFLSLGLDWVYRTVYLSAVSQWSSAVTVEKTTKYWSVIK